MRVLNSKTNDNDMLCAFCFSLRPLSVQSTKTPYPTDNYPDFCSYKEISQHQHSRSKKAKLHPNRRAISQRICKPTHHAPALPVPHRQPQPAILTLGRGDPCIGWHSLVPLVLICLLTTTIPLICAREPLDHRPNNLPACLPLCGAEFFFFLLLLQHGQLRS